MKIVDVNEMKLLEEKAVRDYYIPEIILMENAGKALADKCLKLNKEKILIICGNGNNGGDGLVAARHLINSGLQVNLFILDKKLTKSSDINLKIISKMLNKIYFLNELDLLKSQLKDSDLVIDALFGTGFKGRIEGYLAEVVDLIISSGKIILSADLPSGIEANTGLIDGSCIKANYTVTFGLSKIGLHLDQSRKFVGELEVADISLPRELLDTNSLKNNLITKDMARKVVPKRKIDSHKNNYGHLLVIGGSKNMLGAIELTAQAALKSGTGLVTLVTPKSILNRLVWPEIMTKGLCDKNLGYILSDSYSEIEHLLKKSTVMAIGPGMGRHPETREFMKKILHNSKKQLILDADGINLLSELSIDILNFVSNNKMIITPHLKEMSRLTNLSVSEISMNKVNVAKKYSNLWNILVILKGASTVIASPSGDVYISNKGNPGMATAGSGDVLTGIIGSLLAQGLPRKSAAVLGVYLHGTAGDLAKEKLGEYSLIASDLIKYIPKAFKLLID
ncbi:MAG: NAD(P)H-hydrate dehydratase [Halanaerobiales bacterium]